APEFAQAPELENETAPPGAVAATPKLAPNTAFAGACVPTVIVWLAFCALTVSTTCGAALWLASPAWSYFTLHVPLPLVLANAAPAFVQAPELENETAPPGAVAATPKPVPNTAFAGACVLTVIVWSAFVIVSASESLLGAWPPSPANDAVTPVG